MGDLSHEILSTRVTVWPNASYMPHRFGQRHPLISSKRVSCPSNKIRANVPSFKRRFLLRKGSPQCKTIKAGHAAAKDRISQPYT